MADLPKTYEELLDENRSLKQQLKKLEQSAAMHRRDKAQRRESETRLCAQYQNNPIPTFTWQRQRDTFILLDCNKAARVFTKGEIAPYLNQSAPEIFADRPDLWEALDRCFVDKGALQKECFTARIIPRRGIDATFFFVPPDLVVVQAHDITEQRKTEAKLREKSAELDRYFTTVLDLFCIAGTGGHFRRLNRQGECTLGYSLAHLEGWRFLDLFHPDDVESTLQAVARLDQQEFVMNFVNRYRCKDDSYRWIEWRSRLSGRSS